MKSPFCEKTGKIIHDTPHKAAAAAKRLKHSYHYKCRHCGYWHATTKENFRKIRMNLH